MIPTFLMGGTLPLLVAWSEKAGVEEGRALAQLYGLNTLGAAAGCMVAGFWMVPTLGLFASNAGAATLNLILALVAFWVARSVPLAERGAGGGSPRREKFGNLSCDHHKLDTSHTKTCLLMRYTRNLKDIKCHAR